MQQLIVLCASSFKLKWRNSLFFVSNGATLNLHGITFNGWEQGSQYRNENSTLPWASMDHTGGWAAYVFASICNNSVCNNRQVGRYTYSVTGLNCVHCGRDCRVSMAGSSISATNCTFRYGVPD